MRKKYEIEIEDTNGHKWLAYGEAIVTVSDIAGYVEGVMWARLVPLTYAADPSLHTTAELHTSKRSNVQEHWRGMVASYLG